jgi:hypothetical protein
MADSRSAAVGYFAALSLPAGDAALSGLRSAGDRFRPGRRRELRHAA